jgi:hypothetical protein
MTTLTATELSALVRENLPVANIADLREIAKPNNQAFQEVQGYYAAGDGGGGSFYWNSASTASDNAGTVILPTGQSAGTPGRWLRLYAGLPFAEFYGAIVGQSTAVITAAWQAALAAHKVVRFGDGTFTVSSPLDVLAGGGIIGNGYASVIKAETNFGDFPIIRNANRTPATLAARDDGLLFSNFRINGNKANNSTATEQSHGITLYAVDGVEFENLWSFDCKGDGVIFRPSQADETIPCSGATGFIRSEDNARQGVTVICGDGMDLDVLVYRAGYSGFCAETNNSFNFFRDSNVRVRAIACGVNASGGRGGAILDGNGGSGGGEIENVSLHLISRDCTGFGVTLRNCPLVTVTGEIYDCSTNGVEMEAGTVASNVTFDLDVVSPGSNGVSCRNTGDRFYGEVRVVSAGAVGALFQNAVGGNIRAIVRSSSQQGIIVRDSADLLMPHCETIGNSSHGLWLRGACTGNRFPGLRSTGNGNTGVIEDSGSDNNRVTNARVSGNSTAQVSMTGAASLVEYETLKGIVTTNVGNVGGGEDDLMTFSVAANSLHSTGIGIRITAWGTAANNANPKTVKLYFGSVAILTQALTVSQVGTWRIDATVAKTGANAQDYSAQLVQGGTTTLVDAESGTLTQTDTAAITVKCTGTVTDGGGGINNNDIVQEGLAVVSFA